MMIMFNRQEVASKELKDKLAASRIALIKGKGFDSLEYIQKLVEDTQQVLEVQSNVISEVIESTKVADWVISESQDHHIGDSDEPTPAFVKNFLELFLFHPFLNSEIKNKADALQILITITKKAVDRFGKADTLGLFSNPVEYMYCFNTMCVDVALEEHKLSEADYQFMIEENDLSESPEMKPIYSSLNEKLAAQLDGGVDEDDQ